ncbi:MAG: hypothetical protein PHI06_14310 [Desulfobulbaceae bacterium]|nr:hypothetical protein [Desulfobulbaceae bacterium]
MKVVFECETAKKAPLTKILEADPYADDSFARIGYKVKDGASVNQDKTKTYVYVSTSEEFVKKATEKLKDVATRCKAEVETAIVEQITKEEEAAEGGMGAIFG